jgi:hypothetical protein
MRKLGPGALVICLLFAASAEAKTLTLSGGIKGDSNSKVSMKLKVNKDGVPSKLKALTYSGIDTFVATAPGQLGDACAIGEQQGSLPGAVPSILRGSQPGTWTFNAVETENGLAHQGRGILTPYPKAKKADGYLQFVQEDHSVCASRDFKLRK